MSYMKDIVETKTDLWQNRLKEMYGAVERMKKEIEDRDAELMSSYYKNLLVNTIQRMKVSINMLERFIEDLNDIRKHI